VLSKKEIVKRAIRRVPCCAICRDWEDFLFEMGGHCTRREPGGPGDNYTITPYCLCDDFKIIPKEGRRKLPPLGVVKVKKP